MTKKYYSVTIRFEISKHQDLINVINEEIQVRDTDRSKVIRDLMRMGVEYRNKKK